MVKKVKENLILLLHICLSIGFFEQSIEKYIFFTPVLIVDSRSRSTYITKVRICIDYIHEQFSFCL